MRDNLAVSVAARSRAGMDILRAEPVRQAAHGVVRGQPGPPGGRQGSLQLLVYQLGVRLLCAGEQQEPVAVQQLLIDGQDEGNQWLRTTYGLKHHQVRPGCRRRPAWLRPRAGRSGTHERQHGLGGPIAGIPADHGRPVPDVRGRT